MNKRASSLILGFLVIVVLTILSAVIISRSAIEKNLVQRSAASAKAFWAAEAGIARAIAQLPNTAALSESDLEKDGSNDLQYTVPSATLVTGYTNRWSITSTGRYILNTATGAKIERVVTVVAEKAANSALLANAIETTGGLNIGNNVNIYPDQTYAEDHSSLNFESVFGMTKDALKAMADHSYTNPSANQQPVNGITWVELTGSNKYKISSTWSGSGLLVVNGNGEDIALDISGGWNFSGVVWVVGKISISGTPVITGAVFAESDVEVTNKLTGTPTLTFDEAVKNSTFGVMPGEIISWQEA